MTTKWTPSMLQPTTVMVYKKSLGFLLLPPNDLDKQIKKTLFSHILTICLLTTPLPCLDVDLSPVMKPGANVKCCCCCGINMNHHIHHTCPSRSVFDRSKPCMYGGNSGLLNQTWTVQSLAIPFEVNLSVLRHSLVNTVSAKKLRIAEDKHGCDKITSGVSGPTKNDQNVL